MREHVYGVEGDPLFDERRWEWLATLWRYGEHDADRYGLAGVLLRIAAASLGQPPLIGLSSFDMYELRAIAVLEDEGLVEVRDGCARLAEAAREQIEAQIGGSFVSIVHDERGCVSLCDQCGAVISIDKDCKIGVMPGVVIDIAGLCDECLAKRPASAAVKIRQVREVTQGTVEAMVVAPIDSGAADGEVRFELPCDCGQIVRCAVGVRLKPACDLRGFSLSAVPCSSCGATHSVTWGTDPVEAGA